jgi:hypothetical protein
MSKMERLEQLELIGRNIQQFGFHKYLVTSGTIPRFAYTIGLRESLGAELVLAGAIYYSGNEVARIIETIGRQFKMGKRADSVFRVDELGSFTLRQSHTSWTSSLLLGALDYYNIREVDAYQIVPDEAHWTIDTPNLGEEWSAAAEPIWKWLHEEWEYMISQKSHASTNLDALRGARITEAVRWEEDYWELFAGPGPEVTHEEMRIVPLGALLAADPSLSPVIDLEIGNGLWREDIQGGDWNPWGDHAGEQVDPTS